MLRLWVLVVLGLMATLVAGCGDEEPISNGLGTASNSVTPSATRSSAGGDGQEGIVVPIVSPVPSPAAVPANWPTFASATDGFSFRYPDGWSVDPALRRVQSWMQDASGSYPEGGILVELSITAVGADGPRPSPTGATAASLGGEPSWRVVRKYPAAPEGTPAWSHSLGVVHGGFAYTLTGFFEQPDPDDSVFLQIASTFTFFK